MCVTYLLNNELNCGFDPYRTWKKICRAPEYPRVADWLQPFYARPGGDFAQYEKIVRVADHERPRWAPIRAAWVGAVVRATPRRTSETEGFVFPKRRGRR